MSDLLLPSEVADILRVDVATVLRWVKQVVIEGVVLPGTTRHGYRIKREALDKVLGESQAESR